MTAFAFDAGKRISLIAIVILHPDRSYHSTNVPIGLRAGAIVRPLLSALYANTRKLEQTSPKHLVELTATFASNV